MEVSVAQSRPTFCDPKDCSPPGSSVRGILQARLLEWVAISYSNEILIKALYLQARVGLLHIYMSLIFSGQNKEFWRLGDFFSGLQI